MAALESFISEAEMEALYRPTGEARGLPARAYVDEDFWNLEREKLFPRTWITCAFESDVPEPGDICPVSVAGWELIVTRGQDGAVNVFHNVLRPPRHAGGRQAVQGRHHHALPVA